MFRCPAPTWLPALAVVLAVAAPVVAAAPINKCLVGGTVTFQQGPCPPDQARRVPTVQALNAEASRQRAAAAAAAASASPAPSTGQTLQPASSRFHCDGRQYCSQMTSCAEAQYFLAHCPETKMDGDHNGTPCERQWCAR